MTLLRPRIMNGLHWVRGELDQSLSRARALIEAHAEKPSDPLPLQQAYVELHQVRGTASMIQCFSVSATAEEMKLTLHDLMHGKIKETEAAHSTLLGSTVQLADYIDALAQGREDCALILQPLINELRLARGKTVLTEADLFTAQIQSAGLSLELSESATRIEGAAQVQALKLLPVFQAALLVWLRNGAEAKINVARLGRVAEHLAINTLNPQVHLLWRAAAACVESLLAQTLEDSIELKRLFGAAGHQIKLLAESGEASAAAKQGDLAWRLLFYAGRSRGTGARVNALREAFHLKALLPTTAEIDSARRKLQGANSGLLARVSDEIRADLTQVKDAIDLTVRAGGRTAEMPAIISRLQRVAGTLAALGLSALQRVVANQARLLEAAGSQPDGSLWMEVATALLRVESSLDDALLRGSDPRDMPAPAGEETLPSRRDLREGQQALMRESLINLARLKTAVDTYIKSGGSVSLVDAAKMLGEIAAGLHMLAARRAAQLINTLERYVRSAAFAQIRESRPRADVFADAVTAAEVVLESLRDQAPGGERLLDDLAAAVGKLEFTDVPQPAPTGALETAASGVTFRPAALAAVTEAVDDEIREVFLDEAGEVSHTLMAALPRWLKDQQDRDTLTTIRRAFHTLKGSGRMVGATDISEFGWSLENLLNRVLDGTIVSSAALTEILQQTVALLPGLIQSFRDRQAADPAAAALGQRAKTLAQADRAAAGEPDLAAVFRDDAGEKLALVLRWLSGLSPEAQTAVDDDSVRAFHTLRGAAAAVQAEAFSQLSGALEDYLEALRRDLQPLEPAALVVIGDAVSALHAWLPEAGTPAALAQSAGPWLARIAALRSDTNSASSDAAMRRELAEIFAVEAFDLVQKLERLTGEWRQAADPDQAPRELKLTAHTLMGAAQMSDCAPVAVIARALYERFEQAASQRLKPTTAATTLLASVYENLYQHLDAYRDGALSSDAAGLGEQIRALSWQGQEADVLPETQPSAPAMPALEREDVLAPAAAATVDPELFSIFLAEARELLESLDAGAATWEQYPAQAEAADGIKRSLHTFKGGARMAGLRDTGEAAHQMESWIEQVSQDGQAADTAFFARLHHLCDGLHRVVDGLARGQPEDAAALLAELGVATHLALPAAPLPSAWPSEAPPAMAAGALSADSDEGLSEIFRAEAAELMEVLQRALDAWQSNSSDQDAMHEVQRALHTLKGGARMSGQLLMGDAVHAMEERVNQMEAQTLASDGDAFAVLRSNVDGLNSQLDLLARGQLAPLAAQADEFAPTPESAVPPVAESGGVLTGGWDAQLFWRPAEDGRGLLQLRTETARVPVEQLDGMLNRAGEISIYRSRLEEHVSGLQAQLNEMTAAITRVREQLRMMDIETEAQIAARGLGPAAAPDRYQAEFDPLEMDRYTRMQELSRALSESVGDLGNLHGTMDELVSESQTLLLQQGRINTQVQQGLMGTLMVPFSRQVARLQRVVKQTAYETGKQADIVFSGIGAELDRNVLERMTAPLEHLLRNAVVHGLEDPMLRVEAGKSPVGRISVSLKREGTQLLMELADDGSGLNFAAIRTQAAKRGLMPEGAELSEDALAQFIFSPGFSTAKQLTQSAGRGIGMDVVASEVRQLGGTLELTSEAGKGTRFLIRLPLNLALSQALLVEVGAELYALPLPSVDGIARIPVQRLDEYTAENGPLFNYGGQDYRVRYLGDFTGQPRERVPDEKSVHAILIRMGEGLGAERRIAVVVDLLLGNREIVTKTAGALATSVTGVSGATIMPDGHVVLILDVPSLVQERSRRALLSQAVARLGAAKPGADAESHPLIMVVDDSVTIRRVTERLLLRHGYRVSTAKDGLDAMSKLHTESPAAVLLDIEMPRADGFEVATFIRNHERISRLPILMITSRSGDKHRERARGIGVNRYLIKPFQEEQLMAELQSVLEQATAGSTSNE